MFKDLCTPAHLYLVLSIITIIMGLFYSFSPLSILVNVFWVALWTFLLNFLCKKGFTPISWILVFIPLVVLVSHIILTLEGHKVHHHFVTKEGMSAAQKRMEEKLYRATSGHQSE